MVGEERDAGSSSQENSGEKVEVSAEDEAVAAVGEAALGVDEVGKVDGQWRSVRAGVVDPSG